MIKKVEQRHLNILPYRKKYLPLMCFTTSWYKVVYSISIIALYLFHNYTILSGSCSWLQHFTISPQITVLSLLKYSQRRYEVQSNLYQSFVMIYICLARIKILGKDIQQWKMGRKENKKSKRNKEWGKRKKKTRTLTERKKN